MSKPEDFKFDSRVRERFMRQRTLSSAEVQKHLEQLPDLEGEYDVAETPQPAVTPARSEVTEEPLVFDGIRRLQAFADSSSAVMRQPVLSSVSPMHAAPQREPESRSLGTPLRSALMESEISGVGAGAVSAALGAMAAEQRAAAVPFVPPSSIPRPSVTEVEPHTPVTLRSQASPPGLDDDSDDDVEPERVDIPPDSEDLS